MFSVATNANVLLARKEILTKRVALARLTAALTPTVPIILNAMYNQEFASMLVPSQHVDSTLAVWPLIIPPFVNASLAIMVMAMTWPKDVHHRAQACFAVLTLSA